MDHDMRTNKPGKLSYVPCSCLHTWETRYLDRLCASTSQEHGQTTDCKELRQKQKQTSLLKYYSQSQQS